jgi:hypothetical protein
MNMPISDSERLGRGDGFPTLTIIIAQKLAR